MLSKLLKYELKATARIFLPLYLVLLSFAVINRLIISLSILEWQTPQVISMMIYVTIMIAMFVITFVMMIQRFYKNLLSDEGYLMFTLPTRPWKHIVSKLLVAMMWIVTSGIVALTSIFIIAAQRSMIADILDAFRQIQSEIAAFMTISTVMFLVEALLIGVASLASGVLIIYASLAIGQLFNQNKIIASVGAFIALSTITQILYAIIGSVVSISINVNTIEVAGPIIHLAMWLIILLHGLLGAGYFLIANHILSKRLNLE